MAGISSQAAGGLENKHKYNGIELDTTFGINEYEAQLRDLDPQLGRWWQIDPETEDQEMWSPYTSNYDNPILYQDPRGNEGETCCKWLKDIATTVVATTAVVIDNVTGFTNVTGTIANSGGIPSSQTAVWNNAVTTANQTSLVAGTATAVVGGGVATGGGEVTVATGGLSSEVTVPAAVVGLGTAAVGTWVAANATKNLSQGNGLIKNNNSSTSSSTRSTNKRKPDNTATGDHSVIDKNGNTTYKENPQNPSGFDEQKRTDVKGKAHTNTNGTKVETPHVHEKGQKNVRPAVKGQDY